MRVSSFFLRPLSRLGLHAGVLYHKHSGKRHLWGGWAALEVRGIGGGRRGKRGMGKEKGKGGRRKKEEGKTNKNKGK